AGRRGQGRTHPEGPGRVARPRTAPAPAARLRHPALVLRQGLGRPSGRRAAGRGLHADAGPADHGGAAVGGPRGGHHHGRRGPLRGGTGLRPALGGAARRPEPHPEAVRHVPPHPAPRRRRAAALRGPLRSARPQGRPDRRAGPLRHPGGLLARAGSAHRHGTGSRRGV
ncbi:LOW QUALITY PROTEIN: conserved hypothetical protein, partial [Streptomyces griseoflavus Tu4000]